MLKRILFPHTVSKREAWFLIFFLLNACSFFNCALFQYDILKYGRYIINAYFASIFLIDALKSRKISNSMLERMVIAMYWMVFVALVVGIADGQYISYALKGACNGWLLWGVFFHLRRKRIPEDYVINLLAVMVACIIAVTALCYIQFPDCWFGLNSDEIVNSMMESRETRGMLRFQIPGKFLICLFIFYLIQNFTIKKEKIAVLFLLFVMLLLNGHRFPMAVCVVLSVQMVILSPFIKVKHKIQMLLTGILLWGGVISCIPMLNEIVNKSVEMTEDTGSGADLKSNIRWKSADYFFREYNASDDYYHKIIGNGIYFPNSGAYAKKMEQLHEICYWEVDVEFAAFYIYFGIIGLIILSLWFIAMLFIKIPSQYNYIKYFLAFIVFSMSMNGWFIQHLIYISMLSYVLVRKNRLYIMQKQANGSYINSSDKFIRRYGAIR